MLPAVHSDTGHQFWDELHLPGPQKQVGSGNVSTPVMSDDWVGCYCQDSALDDHKGFYVVLFCGWPSPQQ